MASREYLHDTSARILGGLRQRVGAHRTPIRDITLSQWSKKRLVVPSASSTRPAPLDQSARQSKGAPGADEEHRSVVLRFFRAEIVTQPPSPMLHGRKGTAFVHVDGIDSIFSRSEVQLLRRL
jgi:hypothetical protein